MRKCVMGVGENRIDVVRASCLTEGGDKERLAEEPVSQRVEGKNWVLPSSQKVNPLLIPPPLQQWSSTIYSCA